MKTRLEKKIEKLEAELKDAKAKKIVNERKERNGQLVSMGIMIERNFNLMTPEEKEKLKLYAENLDERNKSRVLAAFDRIAQEA